MENRLKILFDADIINQEVYLGMLRVVEKLENQWKFEIRHSQGEMAITHMANALMRASKNEPVIAMDSTLFAEVAESALYPELQQINDILLQEFSIKVPESEITYLIANLYALKMAQQA